VTGRAKAQTGFRLRPGLADAARARSLEEDQPGNLNAVVELLLEGYLAGTVQLPERPARTTA